MTNPHVKQGRGFFDGPKVNPPDCSENPSTGYAD